MLKIKALYNKAVARFTPNAEAIARAQADAAARRIRACASKTKVPFNWDELKKDRDEGRP